MQEEMHIEQKNQPRICPFQLHRVCYNIVKKIKLNSNLHNTKFNFIMQMDGMYCSIIWVTAFEVVVFFLSVLFNFFSFVFFYIFFNQIWIHFPVVQENVVIQVEPVLHSHMSIKP